MSFFDYETARVISSTTVSMNWSLPAIYFEGGISSYQLLYDNVRHIFGVDPANFKAQLRRIRAKLWNGPEQMFLHTDRCQARRRYSKIQPRFDL